MCTSFNDVNVTENRKLLEQAKTFFTPFFHLVQNPEDRLLCLHTSQKIFCSSKYPLSSVNLLCFSHLKKIRSHIKNFSDGIDRFILGLQYDKIAQNGNTIPLKLTKICNPHSRCASMRSAKYQITALLKFLIITRIIYTNLLTIIQSKSLPVFWIVTLLSSVSAQLSDYSLGSLRLYKSI